ncbi:MAG: hypothetical protein J0M04_18935 [Verrucomicrobia bacterium]|nr:hypothetical protein [Verrucomicrobiota bacterium]
MRAGINRFFGITKLFDSPMKPFAVSICLLPIFLCVSYAAEVVIKVEANSAPRGLYLLSTKDSKKKYKPLERFEEQEKGLTRWNGIAPGEYRVCLSPGYSDFTGNCIVVSDISVNKGKNIINVHLPKGKLEIVVNYRNVPLPRRKPHSKGIFLRVDKVGEDGHLDRHYRQWLHTDIKEGLNRGRIQFLVPGTYRITAFHNDVYPQFGDVGYGILEVTEESLKAGKATLDIDKTVEPAGTGQPATKPAIKPSVKDQPSTPTLKDRPR